MSSPLVVARQVAEGEDGELPVLGQARRGRHGRGAQAAPQTAAAAAGRRARAGRQPALRPAPAGAERAGSDISASPVDLQAGVADVMEARGLFLLQAARSMLRTRGGVRGGSRLQSGSTVSTAAKASVVDGPLNNRCPTSISYSTQPKAQMSDRWSTTWPRACSGLM